MTSVGSGVGSMFSMLPAKRPVGRLVGLPIGTLVGLRVGVAVGFVGAAVIGDGGVTDGSLVNAMISSLFMSLPRLGISRNVLVVLSIFTASFLWFSVMWIDLVKYVPLVTRSILSMVRCFSMG